MSTHVTHSIDASVPVRTAYDQWTQFESFPRFMDGVERIDQLTDTRTHWVTRIAGVEREFDAEIVEQAGRRRRLLDALFPAISRSCDTSASSLTLILNLILIPSLILSC